MRCQKRKPGGGVEGGRGEGIDRYPRLRAIDRPLGSPSPPNGELALAVLATQSRELTFLRIKSHTHRANS